MTGPAGPNSVTAYPIKLAHLKKRIGTKHKAWKTARCSQRLIAT